MISFQSIGLDYVSKITKVNLRMALGYHGSLIGSPSGNLIKTLLYNYV